MADETITVSRKVAENAAMHLRAFALADSRRVRLGQLPAEHRPTIAEALEVARQLDAAQEKMEEQ